MFKAQSAHHQEVNDANCTNAVSGIVTLCKWPSCATVKAGLLMMSGLRLKHVEEFNLTLNLLTWRIG
jgi:hypothetical protein